VVYQVAVCGPAQCTEDERRAAYRLGQLLAEDGAVTLCGGGAGVMAAVAAGARDGGGLVVGIRPDAGRETGGADPTVTIVTNMGQARNAILVWSADAVIAVGGSWGTLSEVALAMRRGGVPVVWVRGWRIAASAADGIAYVDTPEAALAALAPPGPAPHRAAGPAG
jgi:uncharacterized protein (TIGR00725 family)